MYDHDDAEAKTRVTDAVAIRPADATEDALVLIYPPGPNMGKKYELQGKLVNVGRDPNNHLVIDSDSVSRRHARFTFEGGRRLVTDLQSTNGTYVNDKPILTQILENGDQVKIGDTIFKYLVGNDVENAYHEEIYRMTIIDGLTGIYNKRFFLEALEREMSRAHRYGRDLAVLMFDIDHFKRVNDTFGHLAGDYVLNALARLISTRARREEIFARYGGEEFVILLPETKRDGAMELAEQLLQRVASHTFRFEDEAIPITVSIGVATMGSEQLSPTDLIQKADEMLYLSKSEGRNCVRG
ncbi:MAG: GGDEF domain-containing protein [Deltaproteobacteria bacterium]|nr:GGDEF domain-containing protein [Deltaproteobacteria bacterium]